MGLGLDLTVSSPGGGPFSPLSLSPKFWIRSDQIAADRSSWTDLSGNGRHVVQATGGLRPTLNATDASFNGRPSVAFDGTQYMASAAWSVALAQPSTWYVVALDDLASGDLLIVDGLGAGHRQVIESFNGVPNFYSGTAGVAGTGVFTAALAVGVTFNGASTAAWSNSVTTTSPGNPGAEDLEGVTIGARFNGAFGFVGRLAEVIAFSGAHNLANRTSVMSYLASRYAITLV
jgi:hypothetical protein